jgi:hypothetical protein
MASAESSLEPDALVAIIEQLPSGRASTTATTHWWLVSQTVGAMQSATEVHCVWQEPW